MANEPECNWYGASGEIYKFWVYPRHPNVKEGTLGNYIYAKIDQKNTWQPVYIGQGDLSKRVTTDHHRTECIDAKRGTHVHMHINKNEAERLAEEKDLLANYPQAYVPNGCNVKKGG